jgi:hypothetical protein
MKYFKTNIKRSFQNEYQVIGHANGIQVPNGKAYFDRIGAGEIITDAPVFDYFFLESYGEKKDWEWRLQDIHSFIGTGSIIIGWYISDAFKTLLEQFCIAPQTHFYETRLLYKGEKIKYWIFQKQFERSKYIDFSKSKFGLENETTMYSFDNEADYINMYRMKYRELKKDLKTVYQSIKYDFDLFQSTEEDIIITETLKNAIESKGLEGFEFSELDYEVKVGN